MLGQPHIYQGGRSGQFVAFMHVECIKENKGGKMEAAE